MNIHPKYRFFSKTIESAQSNDNDNRMWWHDVFSAQKNDGQIAKTLKDECTINMNSTMQAIKQFVKRRSLGVKCSGKGRTKAAIVKDIDYLLQRHQETVKHDVLKHIGDMELCDRHPESEVFPNPFGSFSKCCNLSLLGNQSFDESKLVVQWVPSSNVNDYTAAISLLLSWGNRQLFHNLNNEQQFSECFESTKKKLQQGMFGQECVGCIVAMYDDMVVGCMLLHRFPLFHDRESIKEYSLENSVLDVTSGQMSASSKVSVDSIKSKNSYLQIESCSIIPIFPQYHCLIVKRMFYSLFKGYPNELFVAFLQYEQMRMWRNHEFILFGKGFMVKDKNKAVQIFKMLRLTQSKKQELSVNCEL